MEGTRIVDDQRRPGALAHGRGQGQETHRRSLPVPSGSTRALIDTMEGTGLHDLSVSALSSLIQARKLSPVELVETLIERVEQHDGQTRAFITRTFELAREQAERAESEIARGSYRGP